MINIIFYLFIQQMNNTNTVNFVLKCIQFCIQIQIHSIMQTNNSSDMHKLHLWPCPWERHVDPPLPSNPPKVAALFLSQKMLNVPRRMQKKIIQFFWNFFVQKSFDFKFLGNLKHWLNSETLTSATRYPLLWGFNPKACEFQRRSYGRECGGNFLLIIMYYLITINNFLLLKLLIIILLFDDDGNNVENNRCCCCCCSMTTRLKWQRSQGRNRRKVWKGDKRKVQRR